MQKFINFFFLLSITLYISFSNAISINTRKNKSVDNTPSIFDNYQIDDININAKKNESINSTSSIFDNSTSSIFDNYQKDDVDEDLNGDNYYLILVNYTLVDPSENSHDKRHEEEKEEDQKEFIYSLMDEINNLIVGNMNTYENPKVVEEIIDNEKLRKRDGQNNQDDIGTVVRISTMDDVSILIAFLSEDLIDSVKDMSGVYDCMPNYHFKYAAKINDDYIRNEARWKNFNVKQLADGHLSLISQGKYNRELVGQYDPNYYYPESAGKDVDIYIIDSSFNFEQEAFSGNRTVECIGVFDYYGNYTSDDYIDYNKFYHGRSYTQNFISKKRCVPFTEFEHGTVVADVVGGIEHGVAPNANIYGIAVDLEPTFSTVVFALEHVIKKVSEKLNNTNRKTILNLSFGFYFNLDVKSNYLVELEKRINKLVYEYNVIVVACAYNDGIPVKDITTNKGMYPCIFDNVICVGATNNMFKSWSSTTYNMDYFLTSEIYRKKINSNYGEGVDIYAPGYVVTNSFLKLNGEYSYTHWNGTSFATPIVAGIAASIMSENPNTQYNHGLMLKNLKELALKDVLEGFPEDHPPTFFANNGKHIVYSDNDIYYGCGINAGYHKCEDNCRCTFDGYCIQEN